MSRFASRALLVIASVALTSCTIELQHELAEDDANEIYVLLQHHGISASKLKEEGGNEPRYIISVPKQDVAAAAQLLKDHSLPRPKADGLAVFKRMKGMIPTQTEERAMFIEALAGEVSNALNRIPGVLEARAIVMIPEVNDLTQPEKRPQPSASVFIKFTPDDGKPPVSPNEVQEFVANSVSEMKKENVKVLMAEAKSVASTEVDPEKRMQSVLGLRMEKASADTFKVMVAVSALGVLLLAGVAAFLVIRKPASNGNGNGRRKPTQEG